jgi:hypothetical protein
MGSLHETAVEPVRAWLRVQYMFGDAAKLKLPDGGVLWEKRADGPRRCVRKREDDV